MKKENFVRFVGINFLFFFFFCSDVSSNSNGGNGHKTQVFPKQGGQLSPTHSIFSNENITAIGSDHHPVLTPPLHINIRGQVSIWCMVFGVISS